MMPSRPRQLPLLLCLLLACAPETGPRSTEPEQELGKAGPRGSSASALVAQGWNPTGYLLRSRAGHTATLLTNGQILVAGGESGNSLRAQAELYDPATGTWSSVSPAAKARFGHTAVMTQGKLLVVGGNNGTVALSTAEVYDPAAGTWGPTGALAQARTEHTATLLPSGKVLVVGGNNTAALASAELYDPAVGAWSSAGSLMQARRTHTTTLLLNGKVLVVGGRDNQDLSLGSAEEYDVASGTWSSTSPGSLTTARDRHSALLLPDGRLLVVGGYVKASWGYGPVSAAEVYDPASRTWSSAEHLTRGRYNLTATLLPTGGVLVVGGQSADLSGIVTEVVAEVYVPATATRASVGSLSQSRREHSATLLPDGRVLVAGGRDMVSQAYNAVDVYSPASRKFSPIAPLLQARFAHTATLLNNGGVLVVGGYGGAYLASAEVYDSSTGTWTATGSLMKERYGHTATLMPDNKVLVVGGYNGSGSITSAEVYDPSTGTWTATGSLQQPRARHAAVPLRSGRVLVLGGEEDLLTPLASAEVYDPVTGTWSPARPMRTVRRLFTATLLPGDKVLAVGGEDSSRTPLASTELYEPELGGIPTGPLPEALLLHTATLLPGGKVFVAGAASTCAVYDAATGSWSSVGPLAESRQSHTATLLPGGGVLLVGGYGGAELSSAELYLESVQAETRRPLITAVSPSLLEHGTPITVAGQRFLGSSEGGSGGTASSATRLPLLSLSSVSGEGWVPLLGHTFSDTSVSATLPYVPNGYYLLNVTTQGLTSSRMIHIRNITLPETSLDSTSPMPVTQGTTATFTFSSTSPASFTCNLDGTAFTSCSSPQRYFDLSEGLHTFRVRARDPVGNVDPTPAEYTWEVDRTRPETQINTAPSAFTHLSSAHFASSASEPNVTFECRLDGAAFTPCAQQQDYNGLAEGGHTFQVRATDKAGNVDSTAAEYRWQVDTTPPQPPVFQTPTTHQRLHTAQLVFTGTADLNSTVRVFVDGTQVGEDVRVNEDGTWELHTPPLGWKDHTATATATDRAGNTSEPSVALPFTTAQRGYYALGCAASPSALPAWPWALVAVGLLGHRRSRRSPGAR